jgi:hypothetical protein
LKEFSSTVAFEDLWKALVNNFDIACTPIKNNEFLVLTVGNRIKVELSCLSTEELKDFNMLNMPPKPMNIDYGELLQKRLSHKTLLYLSLKCLLGGRSAEFITDTLIDVDHEDGVIVFHTATNAYVIEIEPLLTPIYLNRSYDVRDQNSGPG